MPTKREKANLMNLDELAKQVSQLYQIIVIGNVEKGEPGLLENVRNIVKDISFIKEAQVNLANLEKRVKDIEDRHRKLDDEKKEKKKTYDALQLQVTGVIILLVINFVWEWLKNKP